jgi:hypothetical protein
MPRPTVRLPFAALTAAAALLASAGGASASSPAAPPAPVAGIVPRISGPIASLTCPPAPLWCTRKLRSGHGVFPGVTITHLRAHMRPGHGSTQDIYKVSWKLSDPWVHMDANPVNIPTADGGIRLGTISHWASWGAPPGFVAAMNGDFFVSDWSGFGTPSGMLVHNRRLITSGWGGPGVGFPSTGGMRFDPARAVATKIPLPGGRYATVGAFVDPDRTVSNQLASLVGDQVAVYTAQGRALNVPTGYSGFVVGSPDAPTPFRKMLTGTRRITGSNGTGEQAAGFRFEVPGARDRSIALPAIAPAACPTYVCPDTATLTLGSSESMLIAKVGSRAELGLEALATGPAHAVTVPLDDAGWQNVTEVVGGKPWLVKDGVAANPRAHQNAPGMSPDCWQWCYQHWRPALAESKHSGWLIITGAPDGTGVYGWDWSKMLVQLGAQNAIGFDNNSSTELYAPAAGTFSFYRGWQRSIAEATSVSYHR